MYSNRECFLLKILLWILERMHMDCKNFERQIPAYFEDKLDGKELEVFIHHIMQCENCMEELTIQYLIAEGMQRIEDGSNIDIQKEISQKIVMTLKRVKIRKRLQIIRGIIKFGIILTVVGYLLYLLW